MRTTMSQRSCTNRESPLPSEPTTSTRGSSRGFQIHQIERTLTCKTDDEQTAFGIRCQRAE